MIYSTLLNEKKNSIIKGLKSNSDSYNTLIVCFLHVLQCHQSLPGNIAYDKLDFLAIFVKLISRDNVEY